MTGYSDYQLLEAVQKIAAELPMLLPDKDAGILEEKLKIILVDANKPDRVSEIVTDALKIISDYPPVRNELKAHLIRTIGLGSETRLGMFFEPTPGIGGATKPGKIMVVCPVDPSHYITQLRVKGQRCPQHNVELVPEDTILPDNLS